MTRDARDLALVRLADREAAPITPRAARRAARRAHTKMTVCRLIAALPCRCWPAASAIVRRIWPGMHDA